MAATRKATEQSKHKQEQSIRDTIRLLLSLLGECGVPKIASECFRGAKFDQEDAVADLWGLTFHVMQAVLFLDSDWCGDSLNRITYYSITPSNLPTAQAILRHYLFELGYEREKFYLPVDTIGSREVLLAFSWLLNRTNFFAKLSRHFLEVAKGTQIPLKPSADPLVEQVMEENRVMEYELEKLMMIFREAATYPSASLSIGPYTEALHKLVWLKGLLDSKWRSVQRVCLAHQKLVDKIHRSTHINSPVSSPCGNIKGHLSIHEVFLLRYPNQMKVHLSKLRHSVDILQKLIQWQDCEPLFWQWMESVLDLLEERGNEKEPNQDTDGGGMAAKVNPLEDVEVAVVRAQKLQEEFEGLLKKIKPLLNRVEHAWKHKSRTHHTNLKKELQSIRQQLQFEYPILSLSANPTAHVYSVVEKVNPMDSPVFVPAQTVTRYPHRTFQNSTQLQQDSRVHALHERLEAVTQELGMLEKEIEKRKLEIRNCLESLEKKLPDSLCKINNIIVQDKT